MRMIKTAALLGLLLLSRASNAAVAFNAVTSSLQIVSTNTVTFSHTTAGLDRALVVYIATAGTTTVSGITYAGTAMTLIGSFALAASAGRVEAWGLTNPATGANNVIVTLASSSTAWDAIALSVTGAHQTHASCFTGVQTAGNTSTTNLTVTITTGQTGDLVVSGTISTAGNGTTPGAGQTQRWVDNAGGSNTQGSTKAGAASVAMVENWDAVNTNAYGMVAFNIGQSGVAAPVRRRLPLLY
jgi:hypothetical protein